MVRFAYDDLPYVFEVWGLICICSYVYDNLLPSGQQVVLISPVVAWVFLHPLAVLFDLADGQDLRADAEMSWAVLAKIAPQAPQHYRLAGLQVRSGVSSLSERWPCYSLVCCTY